MWKKNPHTLHSWTLQQLISFNWGWDICIIQMHALDQQGWNMTCNFKQHFSSVSVQAETGQSLMPRLNHSAFLCEIVFVFLFFGIYIFSFWGWLYLLFPFVHFFNYFTLLGAAGVGTVVVLLPAWCDWQLPLQSQHLLLRLPEEPLKFHSARWKREVLQRQAGQWCNGIINLKHNYFKKQNKTTTHTHRMTLVQNWMKCLYHKFI